jgi:hypothetical protein
MVAVKFQGQSHVILLSCVYLFLCLEKRGGVYVELVFFSTINKEWVLLLVVLSFHCRWWKCIFRSKSMSNCHRVCISMYEKYFTSLKCCIIAMGDVFSLVRSLAISFIKN